MFVVVKLGSSGDGCVGVVLGGTSNLVGSPFQFSVVLIQYYNVGICCLFVVVVCC